MSWADNIEARARILHEQIAGMHSLAEKHGIDIEAISAPYYQQLRVLYEEDLPYSRILDGADLIITIKGAPIETSCPSLRVLGNVFASFRKQVEGIVKAISGLSEGTIPSDVEVALTGLTRGSIVLGLQVRRPGELDGQQTLIDDSDPVYQAVRGALKGLSQVAQHIDPDSEIGVDEHLVKIFPDPGVRDVVINAAHKLAPSERAGFDEIVLSTRDDDESGEPIPLTRKSRRVLQRALKKPVRSKAQRMMLSGFVREIDLDACRFELRQLEGSSYRGVVRCVYDKRVGDPREILDAEVRVTGGVEVDPKGRPRLMQIETLEVEVPPKQLEMREL